MRQRPKQTDLANDSPGSVPASAPLRRRAGASIALGVVLLAVAVWWGRTAWSPQTASPPSSLSPVPAEPSFPPATPDVIGLDAEIPQTVGGLKDEALFVCRQLVDDLPDRPEALAVMALTYMRLGQTEDSTQAWQRCLAIAPRFSPAYLGLGEIAVDRADYTAAERYLSRAVELNPDLSAAYNRLVEAILHQGRPEDALSVALEYVRRSPDLAESHYWLGQTYIDLRRYPEAKQSHETAIKLNPRLTASYFSLAKALTALGEREKAAEHRRRFAELKEQDMADDRGRNRQYRDLPAEQELLAGVHRSAGDIRLLAGDPRKAEAHWLRGAAVARHVPCYEALAALYERQGRLTMAIEVLKELHEIAPRHAGYWSQAGGLEARRQQFDAAEASYRQAIECDPEHAEAHLGLVQIFLSSGREMPDAVDLAERAVRLAPSAHAYLLLSAARGVRGDHAGALAAIETALKMEPENAELRQAYEHLRSGR